jgi:hypothetical protein
MIQYLDCLFIKYTILLQIVILIEQRLPVIVVSNDSVSRLPFYQIQGAMDFNKCKYVQNSESLQISHGWSKAKAIVCSMDEVVA